MAEQHDYLRKYMLYTDNQESPAVFHRWVSLATLATLMCRRIWLDRGPEGILYPNLYVVLVAGSALCRKNTAIALGTRLYYAVRTRREDNGLGAGLPNAISGKVTTAALLSSMSEVGLDTMHSDASGSEGDKISRPIWLLGAELGVLVSQQAQADGFVDLITEAYTGENNLENVTKTAGVSQVYDPSINLLGGTTPAWIAENLTSNLFNQGFSGRCIFAFAEKPDKKIAFPEFSATQNRLRDELVDFLYERSFMGGEMRMSHGARDLFEHWYMNRTASIEDERVQTGFFGREHAHVLKAAMLISVARRDDLTIRKRDLEDAFRCLKPIKEGFQNVFGDVSYADERTSNRYLASMLRKNGEMSRTELLRKVQYRMSSKELDATLNTLAEAGVINVTDKRRGARGPATRVFSIKGERSDSEHLQKEQTV